MLTDITLKITPQILKDSAQDTSISIAGHLGTHFDVMDKEFPLDYTTRKGFVFDVSKVKDRDIDIEDIDDEKIEANMFIAFYTGYIESVGYGSKEYFSNHPQLSKRLIDLLLNKNISIIGVDFAGIRRGEEHIPTDKQCAHKGTFVIENLCNLKTLCAEHKNFIAHTYPLNYAEVTGIPCRVIAES